MPKRAKSRRFSLLLRRAIVPALAIAVMAMFGLNAVLGANGVLAYGDYQRAYAKREAQLAQLSRRRDQLRNHVQLLDPRHANPDMVDELVHKRLNVVHPDEVIVPLDR